MTEAEQRMKECYLQLQIARTNVTEADNALEHGYARLQAKMEEGYCRLKLDAQRVRYELEVAEAYYAASQKELDEESDE